MTRAEVSAIVASLVAAYSAAAFSSERVAIYEEALQRLDRDVLADAVRRCILSLKFPPTLAEVFDAYNSSTFKKPRLYAVLEPPPAANWRACAEQMTEAARRWHLMAGRVGWKKPDPGAPFLKHAQGVADGFCSPGPPPGFGVSKAT